jgi:hypothetical protein
VCALPKKDLSQELKNHISKVVCKYLDLKYFLRQQLPKASDVYAYSVVLLELITRQWAIDHMWLEEFNLNIEWVNSKQE